jgi:PPOX class probable F420-dependent enzyme
MSVRATALSAELRHFLEAKRFAVVGSKNPDSSPHLAVMWYLLAGDEIMVNSAQGRIKDRNLALDPRMSVMVADGYSFVRIDGKARIEHDQKIAHADIRRLALRYYGDQRKVDEAMRTNFSKQHRISYYLPIHRVYAQGF